MRLLFFIATDWYCKLHWYDRLTFFKKKGFQVHIVTNFSDKAIQDSFEQSGFITHHINLKRKSLNPVGELRALFDFLCLFKKIRPDILHTVTVKPNLLGGIAARLHKTPLLATVTGLGRAFDESAPPIFRFARVVVVVIYRQVAKGACLFLFENSADRQQLVNAGIVPLAKAKTVNGSGVDTQLFKPADAPRGRKVLFASRMLWAKGFGDLVEAKRIKGGTETDFELIVAGLADDDVHDAIPAQYLIELEQAGLITWLGQVDDMPALISSVDIVCLPSRYREGIPRILIEGAACGKPLIATDIPGCRDIVRQDINGLLVSKNDPVSIGRAITKILDDPKLYEAFAKMSRLIAKGEYANEIICQQFGDAYDALLSDAVARTD